MRTWENSNDGMECMVSIDVEVCKLYVKSVILTHAFLIDDLVFQ